MTDNDNASDGNTTPRAQSTAPQASTGAATATTIDAELEDSPTEAPAPSAPAAGDTGGTAAGLNPDTAMTEVSAAQLDDLPGASPAGAPPTANPVATASAGGDKAVADLSDAESKFFSADEEEYEETEQPDEPGAPQTP